MNEIHPLLNNLIACSPRTGSTVYGDKTIAKDEDVLIHPKYKELVRSNSTDWLVGSAKYLDAKITSYKHLYSPLNLIVCHTEDEFDLWLLVTKRLKKLVKQDEVFGQRVAFDKPFRTGAFVGIYQYIKSL